MQVGWATFDKLGDFRQIAGYISKTVQDRRVVSNKVEWEVECAAVLTAKGASLMPPTPTLSPADY